MESGAQRWPLPSGEWLRDGESRRWTLSATPAKEPVKAAIPQADLYWLTAATRAQGASADAPHFPPEFRYSPDSGEPLAADPARAPAPWAPPFGSSLISKTPTPSHELRGLSRAPYGLRPAADHVGGRGLQVTDEAAFTLPLPPPGRYEFCVARCGAQRDVLLALEPGKGALFAWLPRSQGWLPFGPSQAALSLADWPPDGGAWGMEMQQDAAATTLFLPTVAGLAVLRPDALSLTYAVDYHGNGPALGAPIAWAGDVWAPVRAAAGRALVGAAGRSLPIDCPDGVRGFGRPVCDARQAVWPCDAGQLVVRKNLSGALDVSWVDWPPGARPRFEFGCPHLSRSGSFWQICWDEAAGSYQYVQMGRPQPEVRPVSSPRFCTGELSYQRGHRIKGDPWLDPEHVYDAGSEEVVIPLVESQRQSAVLGLVIETTSSVSAVLASGERRRAALQYQADDSADLRFYTLQVSEPWHARVFVHDGQLWLYHPDQPSAYGWRLER